MSSRLRARLQSQLLVGSSATSCDQVVHHFAAMQAQDDGHILWAMAQRCQRPTTQAVVESAIAERVIVRNWLLRGTLHMTTAKDVRWLLALAKEGVFKKRRPRAEQLGLTSMDFLKCEKVLIRTLQGGQPMLRDALLQALSNGGVAVEGMRGTHIISHFGQLGLICFGPNQGKQPTFVLLDEWLPKQEELSEEEALCELGKRYVQSRSPATMQDFAWWSGLSAAQVKRAWASAQPLAPKQNEKEKPRGALLLAGFDEYLLSYKDRSAVLPAEHASKVVPGQNGVFLPCLMIDGKLVGTWKRTQNKRSVKVAFAPFEKLTRKADAALKQAAQHYGEFLGMPAEVE